MAKECIICKKKAVSGNNVSHAKNKTKRKFLPNLQKLRINVKGTVSQEWVCTRCIRSKKIVKASSVPKGTVKAKA